MLTQEEVQRYGKILSKQKQKLLKSPKKCRKCKSILNYLILYTDTRTGSKLEWNQEREEYVPVKQNLQSFYDCILKSYYQCPNCGTKIKMKEGKA